MRINYISRSFNDFYNIRSRPVDFFEFNFLIILLISSVVASGYSKEVLFIPSSLILVILGWSLYLFIISRTADLSKFWFSGLLIQSGADLDVFFTIFV